MVIFKGIQSHPTRIYFDIETEGFFYAWNALAESFEEIQAREEEFLEDIQLQKDEQIVNPSPRLTRQELIPLCAEKYRHERNLYYVNGMIYNGVLYSITDKVKQDYTALIMMKDNLQYPYIVWGENGKNSFNNSTELINFISEVFSWCQNKEIECQTNIENLQNKTRFELLQILNPPSI